MRLLFANLAVIDETRGCERRFQLSGFDGLASMLDDHLKFFCRLLLTAEKPGKMPVGSRSYKPDFEIVRRGFHCPVHQLNSLFRKRVLLPQRPGSFGLHRAYPPEAPRNHSPLGCRPMQLFEYA